MAKRGRPKKPKPIKTLVNEIIPADDIFNKDEKVLYDKFLEAYLQDFDEDQLTSNDMDDIVSIAVNRVLELRLLKAGRDDTDVHIDSSMTIERLRKQSEKLKENLATRRRDRIDPKKMSGFSIMELAASFDKNKKQAVDKKTIEFLKEEKEVRKSKELIGNRLDPDVNVVEEE